jgi:hypothetical protein
MLNMLGRLMWVAVGALGVKAWEAAEAERRKGTTATGAPKRARKRKTAE